MEFLPITQSLNVLSQDSTHDLQGFRHLTRALTGHISTSSNHDFVHRTSIDIVEDVGLLENIAMSPQKRHGSFQSWKASNRDIPVLWGRLGLITAPQCCCYAVSGSQNGKIFIWDIHTGELKETLMNSHGAAVLCLLVVVIQTPYHSRETKFTTETSLQSGTQLLLFAGSSDTTISVWNLSHFFDFPIGNGSSNPCIRVRFEPQQGDVLSLALHSDSTEESLSTTTLYAGFQTTLIGFLPISDIVESLSTAIGVEMTIPVVSLREINQNVSHQHLAFGPNPQGTTSRNANVLARHCGFVECLGVCPPFLFSGGGDGLIHVWKENCHVNTLLGHKGGVLCVALTLTPSPTLYSGSRDRTIRVWDIETFICRYILKGHMSDVLSLGVTGNYLFSGSISGELFCWCRRTQSLLIRLELENTMSEVSVTSTYIVSDNTIPEDILLYFNATDDNRRSAFSGPQFSLCKPASPYVLQKSTVSRSEQSIISTIGSIPKSLQRYEILAACSDGILRLWNISFPFQQSQAWVTGETLKHLCDNDDISVRYNRLSLDELLRKFVAIPSVSGRPPYVDDCWSAARFLSNCFEILGASVQLVEIKTGHSPVVVARLGNNPNKATVLFYSHYDVVPALSEVSNPSLLVNVNRNECTYGSGLAGSWNTDPWTLTRIDEYYYGRGVTDNKGPLLAQIFAVLGASGVQERVETLGPAPANMPVNVVWISEGEEENGSTGFENAILSLQRTSHILDDVSCVVCTNSYWVGDETPCLVAGMRGVIDATITVHGGNEPLGYHSGVHGGAIVEPFLDLVAVISGLVDNKGKILIPNFYDDVDSDLGLDPSLLKDEILRDIEAYVRQTKCAGLRHGEPSELLKKRWLEPVLSITEIWSSPQERNLAELGQTFRVIASRVSCNVSIRCVANQNLSTVASLFEDHIREQFKLRDSPNHLDVFVTKSADWWVGDISSDQFQAAVRAVETVWGQKPLIVREGGTMPVIRFLQDTLRVPVVHMPIGQASDAAHLPNERMRIQNLRKGVEMLGQFLVNLTVSKKTITKVTSMTLQPQ